MLAVHETETNFNTVSTNKQEDEFRSYAANPRFDVSCIDYAVFRSYNLADCEKPLSLNENKPVGGIC